MRFITIVLFAFWTTGTIFAEAPEIKAQLGVEIKTSSGSRKAKARDEVKAGDSLVAYSMPAQDGFVYVVISNGGKSILLNAGREKGYKNEAEAFPSEDSAWKVPGGRNVDLAFIVSREAVSEMTALQKGVSTEKWVQIEEALREKAKVSDAAGKPTPIAANVRSIGAAAFARQLPTYSGAGLIVARFHLDVQDRR